jgi:hypothetical protein
LVIGYEDETGDPILIDMDDNQFPVYTAMYGDSGIHAVSLKTFISGFGYMKKLSFGRENPVALEENLISKWEQEQFLKKLLEPI